MEKTLPKSLVVLTFSCGTIGMNSRFFLWYFYFSGTIEKILEDLNWKSIEMSTICFGNGI